MEVKVKVVAQSTYNFEPCSWIGSTLLIVFGQIALNKIYIFLGWVQGGDCVFQ